MKRTILKGTVAFLALMTASGALANDYNSGIVTKTPSSGFTDVEFGSNWYIRGDIAYNIDGREDRGQSTVTLPDGVVQTLQSDYDDAFGVRVGFGNYITPNFRVEATVEGLFNSSFSGVSGFNFGGSRQQDFLIAPAIPPSPANPGGVPAQFQTVDLTFDSAGNILTSTNPAVSGTVTAPITGSRETTAEYSATSFLLSGYFDLPSMGAFTPYVGAGIGVAQISFSQITTLNCSPTATEACAFPSGALGEATSVTRVREEDFWALAYQLSLGTAIAIDERLSLDVGYSYSDYDSGDPINYNDGTAIDPGGFAVHQVRAGLRYNIF